MQQPNINTERAVLSSILFDDTGTILEQSRLQPTDFFYPFHKKVFQALLELKKSGQPTEEESVNSKLTESGDFDEVGMLNILSANPISNLPHYESKIKESAIARKFDLEVKKILSSDGDTAEKIFAISRLQEKLEQGVMSSLPPVYCTSNITAEEPQFFLKDYLPIQKHEINMISGKGGGGYVKSFEM